VDGYIVLWTESGYNTDAAAVVDLH